MNNLHGMISQISAQLCAEKTIRRWKAIARQKIIKFAKNANPFKGIEPTNYYLWIDTKNNTFGFTMYGVKPNASALRGFSAPVDKRKPAPEPVKVYFGDGQWRTVDTERKTGSSIGVKTLDTEYFGVSQKPTQYFGLKRGKRIEAFGITDNTAVPVYADQGFVEWLTTDAADELAAILQDAGYTAIKEANDV